MLVNNFSAGIIGMILAILAFLGIGPAVEVLSKILAAGVNFMVAHDMLPLASIFVEPAKILFLNNAINHGIFSPLGIQQSHELGKSIFFLIEANPGPRDGRSAGVHVLWPRQRKTVCRRGCYHPLPGWYP